MKIDRKKLKIRARQRMRDCRPGAMRVALVYLLLTAGVSMLVGLLVPNPFTQYLVYTAMGVDPSLALTMSMGTTAAISIFILVLVWLYTMVMGFGYSIWSLGTSRGEATGYGTLISGFGMAWKVLRLRLFLVLLTFLWYLAVAIPVLLVMALLVSGLVFAGAYLGTDGVTYLSGWAGVAITVVMVVAFVVIMALMIRIMLWYALCDYTLLDQPEAGVLAAVRRSKELMQGRKWEYFKLQLSFVGWWLLTYVLILVPVLVCFLLAMASPLLAAVMMVWMLLLVFLLPLALECWLLPYICLTCAGYYNQLVGVDGPAHKEPEPPEWEFPSL